LIALWIDLLNERADELQEILNAVNVYLETGEPVEDDPDPMDVLMRDETTRAMDDGDNHLLDMLDIISYDPIIADKVDLDDYDFQGAVYHILRGIRHETGAISTYAVHQEPYKLITALEHLPSGSDAAARKAEITPTLYLIGGLDVSVHAFNQIVHYTVYDLAVTYLASSDSLARELAQYVPGVDQSAYQLFHNIVVQAAFAEMPGKTPMLGHLNFTMPNMAANHSMLAVWVRYPDLETEEQASIIQAMIDDFVARGSAIGDYGFDLPA
jgi:hypothetical protein